MKKIVFTDPPFALMPTYVKKMQEIKNVEVKIYDVFPADEEELYFRGKDADIIITDPTTDYKNVLKRWPSLQAVITTSVGVDHIDLEYCKSKNISVINFPGFNARAVAEMALANLITLIRKIPAANRSTLYGGWDFQYFEGIELAGKTLGIIGSGNVGAEMVKIGKGMGMHVIVHTLHPSKEKAKQLEVQDFCDLPYLLNNSDFVMIAVPSTPETFELINEKELHMMKKTAVLINTARWQIVNPFALAKAIYEKTIAGAALDVIEKEPFNSNKADPRIQEMINSNNVILTPHIAWNTKESALRLSQRALEVLENLAK